MGSCLTSSTVIFEFYEHFWIWSAWNPLFLNEDCRLLISDIRSSKIDNQQSFIPSKKSPLNSQPPRNVKKACGTVTSHRPKEVIVGKSENEPLSLIFLKRRLHYPFLGVELRFERSFNPLIQSILEYGEYKSKYSGLYGSSVYGP